MPNVENPNKAIAKQMWLESDGKMPLKDIAAKLGEKDSLVRKWKCTGKWDAALGGNAPGGRTRNVTEKKRKGGQPGNDNSRKHGFYTEQFRAFLDDDIANMLGAMDFSDPEALLESEIELYTMRELLLLRKSFELSSPDTKLIMDSITSMSNNPVDKNGNKGPAVILHNLTKTVSPLSVNHKITEQLTKVQRAKVAAARALAELQQESKNDGDTRMLVNEWVEGVLGEELDDE